jgi:nifR3 family TIM-barrel protein
MAVTTTEVTAPRPLTGLTIGPHHVATPVVLAPMAGITNAAFRQLCRELATEALAREGMDDVAGAGGVYVSEMVTSRALVERSAESMRLIAHGPGESPRSVQLYGVDPVTVGAAVRMLVDEDLADHVDLNFGCPVPKVTRKGGGAALPWKAALFRDIVRSAVRAASPAGVPVTVKMRRGIDDDHLTFLEAGRTAEGEGVAAVALHARTAAQHYSGASDWNAIGELKQAVTSVPVLGNGDIWSAQDALDMVARTGCDGVVVGRGCLGRPWLFADLAAAFAGRRVRVQPTLREVASAMLRHVALMTEHYGDEGKACRDIRKHIAWYLKGFMVMGGLRRRLALVESTDELSDLLGQLEDQPWPVEGAEGPRGRAGSPKRVALPAGWLESRELSGESARMIHEAELSVSGG